MVHFSIPTGRMQAPMLPHPKALAAVSLDPADYFYGGMTPTPCGMGSGGLPGQWACSWQPGCSPRSQGQEKYPQQVPITQHAPTPLSSEGRPKARNKGRRSARAPAQACRSSTSGAEGGVPKSPGSDASMDLQLDSDCIDRLFGPVDDLGLEKEIEGSLEDCNSELLETSVLGLDLDEASVLRGVPSAAKCWQLEDTMKGLQQQDGLLLKQEDVLMPLLEDLQNAGSMDSSADHSLLPGALAATASTAAAAGEGSSADGSGIFAQASLPGMTCGSSPPPSPMSAAPSLPSLTNPLLALGCDAALEAISEFLGTQSSLPQTQRQEALKAIGALKPGNPGKGLKVCLKISKAATPKRSAGLAQT